MNPVLQGKPNSTCTSCRRRKLKCDREPRGCQNCTKADVPCLYPSPDGAPRRKRGPYQKDKTKRERELEHAVKVMEIKCEELAGRVQNQSRGEEMSGMGAYEDVLHHRPSSQGSRKASTSVPTPTRRAEGLRQSWSSASLDIDQLEKRLAIEAASQSPVDDKSHLRLKNRFWSNFSADFDLIRELVDDDPPSLNGKSSMDLSSVESLSQDGARQGFVFSPDVTPVDLHHLHPPSSQILEYWYMYTTNVDPLTKIIHVPSFTKRLMAAKDNLRHLDNGMEALMFSIYFAAISVTPSTEVQMRFMETKETLVQRFKQAMERALAKANFLTSRNLMTLQALVIYLLCFRRQDDSSRLWTLSGIAMRVAQLMDLHCDGTRFELSPFETEMRRRLWWTLCRLESRCAEENGFHPTSGPAWSDTRFPLNINDEDLDPDAAETPHPRLGCTDMTFCLIGFEIVSLIMRLNKLRISAPGGGEGGEASQDLLALKERMVQDCQARLEADYLQYCNSSRPFDWMTTTFTRLILTKVQLIIYHPFDRAVTRPMSSAVKEKLFLASLEVIEYSHALKSGPRIDNWTWFFRNHMQWHALAYVLAELARRSTAGPMVSRSWRILDEVLSDWDAMYERNEHSALWQPMNKLVVRARAARESDLKVRASVSSSHSISHTPIQIPQQLHHQHASLHHQHQNNGSVESGSFGSYDFAGSDAGGNLIWGPNVMHVSTEVAPSFGLAQLPSADFSGHSHSLSTATSAAMGFGMDTGLSGPLPPLTATESAPTYGSGGLLSTLHTGALPDFSLSTGLPNDFQNLEDGPDGLNPEAWADLVRNFQMDVDTV